jgi:D-threo-aldose 1-dehydrogenase
MKAAGLQFSLAHPGVAAVALGASRPERVAEDRAAFEEEEEVPTEFWRDLRDAGLVNHSAPLPGGV